MTTFCIEERTLENVSPHLFLMTELFCFRRYYMQVERLEDGFDLTGPELPRRHYEQKRRVSMPGLKHAAKSYNE